MRRTLTTALLGAALLLVGTEGHALPFSGSFTFQLGTLPPLTFEASGSGSLAGTEIASGGIVPGTETVGVPSFDPITQIEVVITGNGTGQIPGPVSVRGEATLHASGSFTVGRVPFFTATGGRTSGGATGVSAGIGVGNTIQSTADAGTIVQVFNDQWTTGVASTQLTHTPQSASEPTSASATGFRSSTPSGQGRLVAVEVVGVSTTNGGNLPAFATLDLTYTPEPGTALLLGSGVAGLALVARRRVRG